MTSGASLNEIVEFANDLVGLHDHPDYGPMGLQHTGRSTVKVIGSAVSISREIIFRAANKNIDLLIVHHGLFWNNEPRDLETFRGRLSLLKEYNISVLGYHLCRDRHKTFGNNILAARRLGLGSLHPWADVGYEGTFKRPMERDDFFRKALEKFTDHKPPVAEPIDWLTYGSDKISKVAVITGGAPHYIVQAKRDGFDTFVTGETAEPTVHLAQDLGMNFLSLGHYRTETLGVKKLGSVLAGCFGIKSQFI